ncbi:lysosomal Pro-X carboxypeptidase-like [Ixodes scapularis]|uniref:lysosomal Pro-X carboxypeptidase-like n=1 Tax=Ixodes scapularis TaxID=6945 RepID=UPI001C394247|nr:lysosomal Pro-X carboxypeptidase-like [Ixodes scapularis]
MASVFCNIFLFCLSHFFFGECAVPQVTYKMRTFRTKIDHFTFHSSDTFVMRYAVADQYWDFDGGPIFFYTGNENAIENFINHTGLMWEWAPEFKAMLVFAEHRFYGESMPFGNRSLESPHHLGYLSTDQVLADYADLIIHLKESVRGASESPVISFGGSYGGMLSAWIRLRYPHLVSASLASSAPVHMFPGLVPCSSLNRVLTETFRRESPVCSATIRKSWPILEAKFSTVEGRKSIQDKFHLCQSLQEEDYVTFRDFLHDVYSNMALVNYADPSVFLTPLPGYPVKESCKFLTRSFVNDEAIVDAVSQVVNIFFNTTGTRQCNDINAFHDVLNSVLIAWDFQGCTELVMPTCSDGLTDMFYPLIWNVTETIQDCQQRFNVTPDLYKAVMTYGGRNMESASNIIFSNGDADPWAGVGLMESISDTVVAIVIPGAAHHYDLRFSSREEPLAVKAARSLEKRYIRDWIRKPKLEEAKARVLEKATDSHRFFKYLF